MSTWTLDCECKGQGKRQFENDPKPGILVGFQCADCGSVLIGNIPGKSRYNRDKTAGVWENALYIFQEEGIPLTVRRVYYALTVRGAIPKTEAGYRQTCYLLAKMRREGAIPYGWIADNTRWQRKPTTYRSLGAALDLWQEAYRRNLWAEQSSYVEIWIEKDALAGVVYPVTSKYDVPLMVARGYGSISFLHEAAETIKEVGKPAYVYHFGDFDPSGVDAADKVREELQRHGANIHFERIAITPEQINTLALPTRATKKKDPRARKWGYPFSCELDALPAPELRRLVRGCIERHIDYGVFEQLQRVEELERGTLAAIRENLVQEQNS